MSNSVKWRVFGAIVLGLVLAIAPGTELRAGQTRTISSVDVQTDGGTTRVALVGAEDVMYTAFLGEEPERLIIDLPDVLFDGVETPIPVNDGVVTDIVLGAFGDAASASSVARVSIGLSGTSEYELIPDGDRLVIALTSGGAAAAEPLLEPDPAESAAASSATPGHQHPGASLDEDSMVESDVEPIASAEETAVASRILEFSASGDTVEIRADGPIDNVDSFVLEGPDRIVIDFWGAKSGVWPASRAIDSGSVAKVRVGEHSDKVRVVLDLRAPPETHVVAPTETGVRVEIEPGTAMVESQEAVAEDDMVPAAPADDSFDTAPEEAASEAATEEVVEPDHTAAEDAEAASPDDASLTEVQSVHFESMPEVDRVVLTLSAAATATLAQPDATTVVVDLPGVMIDTDHERRVDTREFGGSVEVFSAFRSPEVPGENVRVVLRHHGRSAPSLDWDGPQLRIEVPRSPTPAAVEPSPAPPTFESTPAGAHQPIAPLPADGSAEAVPTGIPPAELDPYGGPAEPASIDVLEEGGFSNEKAYRGRRISLDFKDADIGNILRLIAEVSDLNVIAGEEVAGSVTIRMVEVPWDQALDIVLLTKGLGFMRIGNILRIAPIGVLQREEEARLKERRAKEKLEDLVVKLQPVNYANVGEVAELVKRLLSPRGTVNVDGRTSTLIIKDIPTVIQEATALVKAIDTATPQVLIEAKIVEASLDFSRSLGARWAVGFNPLGSRGGAQDLHLADGSNGVVPGFGGGLQQSNFVVANPVAAAVGTLTLGLLGLDDHLQLDLQLQAAETNSKGKVISSPRVVTLDNREAVIQQGVAIAFTAEDGDSINTSFVDAVLELRVKPHITADKSIIMDIKVSRNAPQLSDASGAVVGIAKNETKTEALVRDGQTMVLGGIYTVDKGRGRSKMPFLADIPVIGVAFRNSTQQDVRRELLVFVTPRIVQGRPGS
jgi:type IV pilus assembly protein PilQ